MSAARDFASSTLEKLRTKAPLDVLTELYRKAPASIGTLGGLVVTWLANKAYADYRLWHSLGPGGVFPHSFLGWILHSVTLLPISLSARTRRSTRFLPPARKGREPCFLEGKLQHRGAERPVTKGVAPHRCITQRVKLSDDSDSSGSGAQDIPTYLQEVHRKHPSLVTRGTSEVESCDAPALFHSPSASSAPSPLSIYYFSLMPRREICHFHQVDGSLHCLLSPADAHLVIEQGWGELHPLSGFGFLGYLFPPFVHHPTLNRLLFGLSPQVAQQRRWGAYPPALDRFTQAAAAAAAVATASSSSTRRHKRQRFLRVPPTFVMVYPPSNAEEIRQVKAIIDASVSFAVGLDITRLHVDEVAASGTSR
ncbi:unnamed protein product [Parajaminaea phylloscopi]